MKYRYGDQEVYALPGGNPDPRESLSEVIVRELREELGVETEVDQLLFCGEVLGRDGRKDALHAIFAVQLIGGLPQLNPEHTSALSVEWLSLNDLQDKLLYPNIGNAIREMLNGEKHGVYLGKIDQPYAE